MTVNELMKRLQEVIADGGGERIVYMTDPQTAKAAEVTGFWLPRDEPALDLECVEWRNAKGEIVEIG